VQSSSVHIKHSSGLQKRFSPVRSILDIVQTINVFIPVQSVF